MKLVNRRSGVLYIFFVLISKLYRPFDFNCYVVSEITIKSQNIVTAVQASSSLPKEPAQRTQPSSPGETAFTIQIK